MHQPMPVNEADRLAALALYEVVDTPPEFAYDALTELAAQICNCPVALISMLEERRQWFKIEVRVSGGLCRMPPRGHCL
jgi:adenylate cyclase